MQARKVSDEDFARFDLILAADRDNLSDLKQRCPQEHQHKLALFLSFGHSEYDEIPDPYYGGDNGFELVLDLIEEASDQLLFQLKEQGRC